MNMKKGFTLIELVLVITILGIVAISALPSFTSVTTEAERASKDTVLGAVQSGLALFRANDMATNGPPGTYPPQLDSVAANTPCSPSSPCFGNVLVAPIGDYRNGRGWTKINTITYLFNDGENSYVFNYNPATGAFSQQ